MCWKKPDPMLLAKMCFGQLQSSTDTMVSTMQLIYNFNIMMILLKKYLIICKIFHFLQTIMVQPAEGPAAVAAGLPLVLTAERTDTVN